MAIKNNWLKKALIALVYIAVWEAASLLVVQRAVASLAAFYAEALF
jgi:hypothetical protein